MQTSLGLAYSNAQKYAVKFKFFVSFSKKLRTTTHQNWCLASLREIYLGFEITAPLCSEACRPVV